MHQSHSDLHGDCCGNITGLMLWQNLVRYELMDSLEFLETLLAELSCSLLDT